MLCFHSPQLVKYASQPALSTLSMGRYGSCHTSSSDDAKDLVGGGTFQKPF